MAAVIQRPLRGSRISTFYPVKNLPSLSSLDSAFQLQEYISLLIRLDVHDVEAIVSLPGTPASDKDNEEGAKDDDKDGDKGKNDVTVDQACWIYEQLRRLAQDLSHPLITTLQQECTRASCPEMKAGEWLYLCVAHGNDGAMEQCCAIDYILHTVDSATALLNSPRTFPSRLQIPQTSHRHFSSLARRLGRIFAHAYFSHREAFEQAEAESSLYARFLALTSKFDLVPAEFLVIPSGQYGVSGEDTGPNRDHRDPPRHQQYPPEQQQQQQRHDEPSPSRGTSLIPKHILQHQLGVDRSGSPNPPGLTEAGGGGIGEHPTAASTARSRFGRSRTDTMVFADAEANAVADELAAKAKAGELESDFVEDGPKTAKPTAERPKEEEEDMDLDTDTQFEISLDPEEEIPGPFEEETTSVPVLGEEKAAEHLHPPVEATEEPKAEEALAAVTMEDALALAVAEDEPELAEAEATPLDEVAILGIDELEPTNEPLAGEVATSTAPEVDRNDVASPEVKSPEAESAAKEEVQHIIDHPASPLAEDPTPAEPEHHTPAPSSEEPAVVPPSETITTATPSTDGTAEREVKIMDFAEPKAEEVPKVVEEAPPPPADAPAPETEPEAEAEKTTTAESTKDEETAPASEPDTTAAPEPAHAEEASAAEEDEVPPPPSS